MTAAASDFDPQELWQARPRTQPPITLGDIQRRARKFRKHARRRQIEGWLGIVFLALLAPVELWYGWRVGDNALILVGCVLTFAGAIFGCWRWRTMNSAEPMADESRTLVEAYRRNLIRLQAARGNLFVQVAAPCLPGIVIAYTGVFLQHDKNGLPDATFHLVIVLELLVMALVVAVTCLVNKRIADRLQRKIDEL